MKIAILIPAYNEAKEIGRLARAIKGMGLLPIVVDDGSTDKTALQAEANGAKVLRNKQNLGKGASLKRGFEYMLNKGYDAVIIMDGDGQHSPDEIQKFIDAASKEENILVTGNRMTNTKKMPFDRKITNIFMSFIMSSICAQKIPDTQCGLRLIKANLLKKISVASSRFEVESEILVKASRMGTKILSIPIESRYGKESSQINPFWDTCRFIVFLLKLPFMK